VPRIDRKCGAVTLLDLPIQVLRECWRGYWSWAEIGHAHPADSDGRQSAELIGKDVFQV